jgi:hypothetical protein
MTEQEQKWVETNNQVCALLRQAHDVLALSSLPLKRQWVGLTDEERHACTQSPFSVDNYHAIEAKLKVKNT